jgi:hypothetical protein
MQPWIDAKRWLEPWLEELAMTKAAEIEPEIFDANHDASDACTKSGQ